MRVFPIFFLLIALTSATSPRRSLGAACECRCCWEIGPLGSGREECKSKFREFLLKPAACRAGCTRQVCLEKFGRSCSPNFQFFRATCRRGLPRALALLAFVGTAIALCATAAFKRSRDDADMLAAAHASNATSLVDQELLLSEDSETDEEAPISKLASDVPFLAKPVETSPIVRGRKSASSSADAFSLGPSQPRDPVSAVASVSESSPLITPSDRTPSTLP